MPALTGEKDSQQVLTLDIQEVGFEKKPVFDFFKRTFDIIVTFIASLFLILPIIVIAITIVAKDKGSPFYFQKRIGKNSKEIKVCKFRSMKIGADNL